MRFLPCCILIHGRENLNGDMGCGRRSRNGNQTLWRMRRQSGSCDGKSAVRMTHLQPGRAPPRQPPSRSRKKELWISCASISAVRNTEQWCLSTLYDMLAFSAEGFSVWSVYIETTPGNCDPISEQQVADMFLSQRLWSLS